MASHESTVFQLTLMKSSTSLSLSVRKTFDKVINPKRGSERAAKKTKTGFDAAEPRKKKIKTIRKIGIQEKSRKIAENVEKIRKITAAILKNRSLKGKRIRSNICEERQKTNKDKNKVNKRLIWFGVLRGELKAEKSKA